MQSLHNQALTEPEIPMFPCTMSPSLISLLEMHEAGTRMISVGSEAGHPEINPDAPLSEQYQAGSAAYWIASYCQGKHNATRVSSAHY